jgi:hypothetical protein
LRLQYAPGEYDEDSDDEAAAMRKVELRQKLAGMEAEAARMQRVGVPVLL